MEIQEAPKKETRRGSKKAILLLVAVFLLGAITGIGGSIIVSVQRLQNNLRHPEMAHAPADRVFKRIGDDLEKHLALTPGENAAVREELAKSRDEVQEIRIKLLQDLRKVAAESVVRIGDRLPDTKGEALRRRANERLKPWGLQPEQ